MVSEVADNLDTRFTRRRTTMARFKRVALALVFAGGLAVSAPAPAFADSATPQDRPLNGLCIICWPGLG